MSAVVAGYGAAVAVLLGRRPLWLDEILQLSATRDGSLAEVIAWVARNPGGVPLGYATQWLAMRWLGYSLATARGAAALFGIGTCVAVAVLARQFDMRRPAAAVLLFALLPLPFRYSLEARPYSEALFFGTLATVLAAELDRRPGLGCWLAYALALAAGLYTQPFSFFLAAGHFLWAVTKRSFFGAITALKILAAGALALALFQPWFFAAQRHWMESIASTGGRFEVSSRAVFMVLHELCGSYAGSVLLLTAASLGLASSGLTHSRKILLAACGLVPVPLALLADSAFGYFFAVRQVIWITPSLALLAAEGLACCWRHNRMLGGMLSAALAVAMAIPDARLFTHSHEDWQSAAHALREQTADGSCLTVLPPETITLYRFFEPGLAAASTDLDRSACDAVVLALTPYTSPEQRVRWLARLCASGFAPRERRQSGGTEIRIFGRKDFSADE